MAILELPDASIHYRVAGGGRPLAFLHGVGSSSHTWEGQLAHFSDRHLCLAPDMRGYAGSKTDPSTISIKRFAADVAALIEDVGGEPAHVVGLSMGGLVAQHLWRDRPELVRSLALSEELAALIPGSRLAVIPGAGHLSNEENPAAFNAALDEFLA